MDCAATGVAVPTLEFCLAALFTRLVAIGVVVKAVSAVLAMISANEPAVSMATVIGASSLLGLVTRKDNDPASSVVIEFASRLLYRVMPDCKIELKVVPAVGARVIGPVVSA